MKSPTEYHLQAAKRILMYLKGTIDQCLLLSASNSFSQANITAYTDADWAGDPTDHWSISGMCIFVNGNLISSSSKKQPTVAYSSTEVEYRAMVSTVAEIRWLGFLLRELGIPVWSSPTLWCDNNSAIQLSQNLISHARTQHIEIDYHFIRELTIRKMIIPRFISSEFQIADGFTKALSVDRHRWFSSKLCLQRMASSLREGIEKIPPPPAVIEGSFVT